MPKKRRPEGEVEEILRAFSGGASIPEVCTKFEISQTSFYRLLRVSRGEEPQPEKKKREAKVAKLEKQLREREREIGLLKSILKKS